MVRGFVDLHCHWIAGIDDGARTVEASLAMLRGLKKAGFDTVMATPHMPPRGVPVERALVRRDRLRAPRRRRGSPLPRRRGLAAACGSAHAAAARSARRAAATDLPAADRAAVLRPGGACLLLDVCALVGKYGKASQKAAEKLLDDEAYEAACSDAHRPEDAEIVEEAIAVLTERVGLAETERLLGAGPRAILGLR